MFKLRLKKNKKCNCEKCRVKNENLDLERKEIVLNDLVEEENTESKLNRKKTTNNNPLLNLKLKLRGKNKSNPKYDEIEIKDENM